MSAQRRKPIDFAAEGLRLALFADRNCGIRVKFTFPDLTSPPAVMQEFTSMGWNESFRGPRQHFFAVVVFLLQVSERLRVMT